MRTKLTTDVATATGQRRYRSLLHCYRDTLQKDGFAALYRGFSVSIWGSVIYRGLYFGLYDSTKPSLKRMGWENNFCKRALPPRRPTPRRAVVAFLVGWAVTVTSGVVAYPFDTVRRRMMIAEPPLSARQCFALVRAEGWRSFFRGAGINAFRGIAGALVLAGYDRLALTWKRINGGIE